MYNLLGNFRIIIDGKIVFCFRNEALIIKNDLIPDISENKDVISESWERLH